MNIFKHKKMSHEEIVNSKEYKMLAESYQVSIAALNEYINEINNARRIQKAMIEQLEIDVSKRDAEIYVLQAKQNRPTFSIINNQPSGAGVEKKPRKAK